MARWKETLATVVGVVATVELSKTAFSFSSRQKMFARDKGACVVCGKRFEDGWLLDCAHDDHDHSKDYYDDICNGRVLCLDHHLQQHLRMGDKNSAYLIQRRINDTHGGRTRKWLEEHGVK